MGPWGGVCGELWGFWGGKGGYRTSHPPPATRARGSSPPGGVGTATVRWALGRRGGGRRSQLPFQPPPPPPSGPITVRGLLPPPPAGSSYGLPVGWMDSTAEERALWGRVLRESGRWVEALLPLRTDLVPRTAP